MGSGKRESNGSGTRDWGAKAEQGAYTVSILGWGAIAGGVQLREQRMKGFGGA